MNRPLVLRSVAELRAWRRARRDAGQRLGFVPTMGGLHEGHLDLVRLAMAHSERVLVSIFVNPAQFGPQEDFAAYPRDLEADLAQLTTLGPVACFAPEAATVYPPGDRTTVSVGWGLDALCGASRPGHFDGVTNVLARLFNLVEPDEAVFGQKDAQQALIVRRLVETLHFPLSLRLAPTHREADGLAMSSRNRYLAPAERAQAAGLYRALAAAGAALRAGERDAGRLAAAGLAQLAAAPGLSPEYLVAVEPATLAPPAGPASGLLLIAGAVRLGRTRLIDNLCFAITGETVDDTLLF
jgi:pantoate--beta-alanine ligase